MIEGGWDYVWPAYAISIVALVAVTLAIALHAVHWAKRAKALEKDKPQ